MEKTRVVFNPLGLDFSSFGIISSNQSAVVIMDLFTRMPQQPFNNFSFHWHNDPSILSLRWQKMSWSTLTLNAVIRNQYFDKMLSFKCGFSQVQLVGLDEESSEFICRNTFDHPYPTTKLMWIPDTKGVYPDLLATSGDYLRVWRVSKSSLGEYEPWHELCYILISFSLETRFSSLR